MRVPGLTLCVSALVLLALGPLVLGEPEEQEQLRVLRLSAIRAQLLSKLRMKEAPNISRDTVRALLPRAPPLQALLDQYDVLRDDPREPVGHEDDEHATTDTIMFTAAAPDPQVEGRPQCCLFSFGQRVEVSRVVRAQLWVHLRGPQEPQEPTPVFLQMSRLAPGPAPGPSRLLRSLKLELRAASWQSMDVKQLLSLWLRQPHTNHGLAIKALDARGQDLAVTTAGPGDEGLMPFLEVKLAPPPSRRRRDVGLDCDVASAESRCCRYPLTVDFEDFGYDWIIAPKRFKANYCSGECEYMHLQKYPHTHLVNNANPRGTAGPCCTPTKMSPINMLYFNREEQIIYGKIPSMVVDRCGCL